MKCNRVLCLMLLLLIFYLSGRSQPGQETSRFNPVLANTGQFGLTFGPAIYHGDLNIENFTLKRSTGMAAGLYGQYYFSNVFGFRIGIFSGLYNGGIKYYEKKSVQVEDSFTGLILEGDLHLIINFSNLFFGPGERRRFIVYGHAGLGYAGWYSKLTNKVYIFDSLSIDNPLSNFNASFVVPAGLGFYYRIGNRMNLGLEYTFRNYFSDKLDNFTAGYPYDQVHYLALNLSFNLGTGMSGKRSKPQRGPGPAEYNITYPVYQPPPVQTYVPPPAVREPLPRYEPPEPVAVKKPQKPRSEEYCYSVQLFAFSKHRYSASWIKKHYKISGEVRMEKEGGTERFVTGRCADLECAERLKKSMIRLGIRDAFIVAYKNGKRHHTVK